jgi:hypothetical protein
VVPPDFLLLGVLRLQTVPPAGVAYALLLAVLAVEATLSGLTWTAFNAESRLEKDRDRDIRDAVSGFESGLVVPAVAALIEVVLYVRRAREPVRDALERVDTRAALAAVVSASTASSRPRDLEGRLVKAWTVVGLATLLVQLSGPVLLCNHIANRRILSDTVGTIAGVLGISGMAILLTAIVIVRQLSRGLARVIKAGKDAAHEA